MKLNILSDIHLENIKTFELPLDCSDQCLILAGDIGYPKSPEYMNFIQKCSSAFKYVIIITGNHEYYHEYVHEIDNYIEKEIVPKLKKSSKVWMVDATLRDLSGTATLTQQDSLLVSKKLSDAGKIFQKIASSTLKEIESNKELNLVINVYNNTMVRKGQRISNTNKRKYKKNSCVQ